MYILLHFSEVHINLKDIVNVHCLTLTTFISAVMQHAKDFRDFHRQVQHKTTKLSKAVKIYHENAEREERKERERIEKERLKRLMVNRINILAGQPFLYLNKNSIFINICNIVYGKTCVDGLISWLCFSGGFTL